MGWTSLSGVRVSEDSASDRGGHQGAHREPRMCRLRSTMAAGVAPDRSRAPLACGIVQSWRWAVAVRRLGRQLCIAGYSQYQTKITPWPPESPNVTEMLISRSRPSSVANAAASSQSESHDLNVLLNSLCRTCMPHLPPVRGRYRFFAGGPFSATAAFTSALNATASIFSPSWMSIARRVFPSRLELNSRDGSGRLAPLANVSFTTSLYASPVQTIPPWDHTGTPDGFVGLTHLHSSVISGSASRISARMRASVSPRHPPRSRMR